MVTNFGADGPAVARVVGQLSGIGRLGVAFSGGVDSATLLALAVRALGPDRVVALLGVSPSLAADERTAAHAVAGHIGPAGAVVDRFQLADPAGELRDRGVQRRHGPVHRRHLEDLAGDVGGVLGR